VPRPPPEIKAEDKDICFTIMPFGGWFDVYYERIYQPAIEAAGLVPRRADDLYQPSAIVHDIWDLTKRAKVVLAELTGKNPNVFYELGLAHALARSAILVTQSMDDVPFDLRALRVIVYDKNNPTWAVDLNKSIQSSIGEVLASPSKSVLPSFLQVDDSHKPSITSTEKELIALRQDVDLLKRGRFGIVQPSSHLTVGPVMYDTVPFVSGNVYEASGMPRPANTEERAKVIRVTHGVPTSKEPETPPVSS
jgi:hypothetical protein